MPIFCFAVDQTVLLGRTKDHWMVSGAVLFKVLTMVHKFYSFNFVPMLGSTVILCWPKSAHKASWVKWAGQK